MGIESHLDTPLAAAVRAAGSQSAFARIVGLSQGYVHELLSKGKLLPAHDEIVLKAERATGISRHDLRPDIYPPEPAVPQPARDLGAMEAAR